MKVCCIAFLVLFGACLPAVYADDGLEDPIRIERPARILPENDASFDATVSDRHRNSGNTLRCWQHGRLLYERSGFDRLPTSAKSAVTLMRREGETVTVINLQDAFCILSSR